MKTAEYKKKITSMLMKYSKRYFFQNLIELPSFDLTINLIN